MSDLSAVLGATTTMKTLADGTFRISVDVEPRFAQQAFALFGAPGTPIALARITNEAAVEQDRKDMEPDHGKHYEVLYKAGWFHNPRVLAKFEIDQGWDPAERIDAIKGAIYHTFDVTSLKEISPEAFIDWCNELGIRSTLPAAFGG